MLRLGPGLAVALAAAVVTAHGLTEVVIAARVPEQLAWLYPVITDGLAAVAYRATGRLTGGARRYAWFVVVLAAAVSGLAQATYLASGDLGDASAILRFGIGAWPAIAAAVVAHLLHLLAEAPRLDPGVGIPPATGADPTRTPATDGAEVGRAFSAVDDGPRPTRIGEMVIPEKVSAEDAVAGGPDGHESTDDVVAELDTNEGRNVHDGEDGVPVLSDAEKRAAAKQDWMRYLQERPEAASPEKKEYGATLATRYGCSMRWSYYRRSEAERELGAARDPAAADDPTTATVRAAT